MANPFHRRTLARRLLAPIALATAGIVLGAGCTAPRQPSPAPEVVIVGFGDSIVYGSNYPRPWLYTLLDRLTSGEIEYSPDWPWVWDLPDTRHDRWYQADKVRVYNSGIDGNTTDQLLSRFDEDVIAVRPESCLILGGANDVFTGVPAAATEQNLARLYRECLDAGITPVACTLTPVKPGMFVGDASQADSLNASIDRLNAWMTSYCADRGIALVDFNSVVRADPGRYLQPDGIHPSEAGHDAMGEAIDLDELGIAR